AGGELLSALREALATGRPGRAEVVVDATAALGGRPAVRLTVSRTDSPDDPFVWERPLDGTP
ncbi:histidine kinase, partial [Streptomyces lydicus]